MFDQLILPKVEWRLHRLWTRSTQLQRRDSRRYGGEAAVTRVVTASVLLLCATVMVLCLDAASTPRIVGPRTSRPLRGDAANRFAETLFVLEHQVLVDTSLSALAAVTNGVRFNGEVIKRAI